MDTLKSENVKQLTFIGKVSKEVLFKNPKLDKQAVDLLLKAKKLNDDAIMLMAVDNLEKEGIEVLNQTIFIKELLVKKGVLGKIQPTKEQEADMEFGFEIAKELGKIDVGQSVVVKNKMVLALEAIEGTDKTIERGSKLAKKGGAVVVKVSKPKQDNRFDIPTVGLKTLKTMKRFGASVLAIEANETFIVEEEKMIDFANKNNIVVVAI